MPNIATVFKAEITRLARKEARDHTDALKKAISAQRAEIATLKRRLEEVERLVRQLSKKPPAQVTRAVHKAEPSANATDGELRFRAGGLASHRNRLGLSASDFALLVGTTGQSIYAWEAGKVKPRGKALVAIAAVRRLGKREAAERLAALKNG